MEPISKFVAVFFLEMRDIASRAFQIYVVAWILAFLCGVDLVPWVQGLSQ